MEIEYTVRESSGIKVITADELKRIASRVGEAFENLDDLGGYFDEGDTVPIWIMTEKPVPLSVENEDAYVDEKWSQTNEPELAERIAEGWDEYAVTVGDQQIVILCGTEDDEYGWLWNNALGEWENYMY